MSWLLEKRRAWIAWSGRNVSGSIGSLRAWAARTKWPSPDSDSSDKFNEAVEREIRAAYDAGYDAGRGS